MLRPTPRLLQSHGLRPWTVRPKYQAYKSPFGPKYRIPFNLHGINLQMFINYGMHFAPFGLAAGLGLLYYLEAIPRARKDIFEKIPILGEYWDREIPPSDNPF